MFFFFCLLFFFVFFDCWPNSKGEMGIGRLFLGQAS